MSRRTLLIIGSLFLLFAVPISAYLIIRGTTTTRIEAEAKTTPTNIRITKLSEDSFTLEWETEAEFAGYIFYGPSPETMTLLGQDKKGNSKFKKHTVVVTKLEPNTTYYYIVVSENDKYQSEGKPFEVKTLTESE